MTGKLLTFRLLGGQGLAVQGEAWCPGPVPRSWWMRETDGEWHAVKHEGCKAVEVPEDPRFAPCRWRHENARERAIDCPWCSDEARLAYIRKFRQPGQPHTRKVLAAWAALFEVKESEHGA